MRNFLLLMAMALMLLIPGTTRAQDYVDVQYLVLTLNDGSVSKFALTDAPEISFNDNLMVVTCDGDELSTELADVDNYTFVTEQVATKVSPITVKDGKSVSDVAFRNAQITGLNADGHVTVYDINGKAITTLVADAEGKVNVDLSNLSKGIYILHTPTKNFKITNK